MQRRLAERGPDGDLSIEKDTEKGKKDRRGVGVVGCMTMQTFLTRNCYLM